MNKNPIINRAGQRLNHWEIISIADSGHGPTTWNCRCNLCGAEKVWRYDAIHKQKHSGKHICACRLAVKELAKSVKMSLAAEKRKEKQVEPVKSEVAMVTDLRDQNGREDNRPAQYRKRPKKTDAQKGADVAFAYARAMEARGMVL